MPSVMGSSVMRPYSYPRSLLGFAQRQSVDRPGRPASLWITPDIRALSKRKQWLDRRSGRFHLMYRCRHSVHFPEAVQVDAGTAPIGPATAPASPNSTQRRAGSAKQHQVDAATSPIGPARASTSQIRGRPSQCAHFADQSADHLGRRLRGSRAQRRQPAPMSEQHNAATASVL